MSKLLILDIQVKAACGVTALSCQLQWHHIMLDRATEAHWPWLCCHPIHVWKDAGSSNSGKQKHVCSPSRQQAEHSVGSIKLILASYRREAASQGKVWCAKSVIQQGPCGAVWPESAHQGSADAGYRMHERCLQRGSNCTCKHTTWPSASALLGLF